ncbi:MAG: glycosyltransferase family 4 protein [Egibacteraceae bacterium]
MMTQLLHVITDTDRRGAQMFAEGLCRRLTEQGRPGRVVALEPGGSSSGLKVPTLGPTRLAASTLRRLRCEIRDATVVVGHGSSTLAACALAGTGLGTPFIYRNIGDPLYWANTARRRARVRLLLRRASAVVALWSGSRAVLVEALGVAEHTIAVIPNGVPAAGFPCVDAAARPLARQRFLLHPDRPTLVYIGALSAEKDVGLIVGAMARLPDCQLLVVGDGPERTRLEAQAAADTPERIRFLGTLQNPAEALAAADAIVLPSRSEGMPAVLIEAGFSGVSAAATAVGAVGEIVADGETGRLFPVGDETALRAAIRDVLEHRAVYGRAARRRCLERFELNIVADAWDAVIERLERAL